MSTSVSEHQRNKGHGNSGNQPYGKPNSIKDHHGSSDRAEIDSWRNQQAAQGGHHHGYGSPDSYNNAPAATSYYGGSFQYQQQGGQQGGYGVNAEGGGGAAWSSNGGGEGGFPSGRGGHYAPDGVFGGGNGGGFGNFGGSQQGYYGTGYGNGASGGGGGDYSAWGPQQQPPATSRNKPHYNNDYYGDGRGYGGGDERGMKSLEHGMGGLGLDKDMKDFNELMSMQGGGDRDRGGGGKKATSWASVASQPAKPQSISKKSKTGVPLPPMILPSWGESKNGVAKAPLAAPVQAPAWGERPHTNRGPPHPPPLHPPSSMPIQMPHGNPNIPPSRGFQHPQAPPLAYMPPHHHHPSGPPPHQQHQQNSHAHPQPPQPLQPPLHSNGHQTTVVAPPLSSGPKYPDELKMKDYNPATFDLMAEGARFFVIKSYSEDDIHRSIKYEIWCSTEHGNKRLDEAFKERESNKGIVYLFFSVNGSGHFCGMAQMMSHVDYHAKASVWSQDKWKGQFKVKWVYVKDVPNSAFRHIRLENNENKPVTNSRDTQEVPLDKGKQVLKILHSYHHSTSIFDDFIHYEKRQEEEDQKKVFVPPPPPPQSHHNNMRGGGGERGGGRGGDRSGFHDRGGFQRGPGRDFDRGDRDHEPREFREHRGGRDGGFMQRNEGGGREYNRDRPSDREFDRGDRDRGGHRGRPMMMRNFEK